MECYWLGKKQKSAKTLCLETCTMRMWKETNVESEDKRTCSISCAEVVEDKTLGEKCCGKCWNKVLGTAVCYKYDIRTVGSIGIQWDPPSQLSHH